MRGPQNAAPPLPRVHRHRTRNQPLITSLPFRSFQKKTMALAHEEIKRGALVPRAYWETFRD